MRTWKVILATLVIFIAGVVTGGLLVKNTKKTPRPKEPQVLRMEMLRRLTRDLGLSAEQRAKVETILKESAERTKILRDLLGPELQAEYHKAVEDICAQLTPEQHKRFDELLRQRPRKQGGPGEKRRQSQTQASTNQAQKL